MGSWINLHFIESPYTVEREIEDLDALIKVPLNGYGIQNKVVPYLE